MRAVAVVTVLALALAACGDDEPSGQGDGDGGQKTLTVYSSLPLQGAQRPQTTDMVKGIELALEQAGNRAGDFQIKYESLDDSTAQAGSWTPEATYVERAQGGPGRRHRDLHRRVQLRRVGDLDPGPQRVRRPPDQPGQHRRRPHVRRAGRRPRRADKYYPSGRRTYVRIVPKDTIQGAALATVMKEDGCTKVQMTNDKEVYGAGLATNIQSAADEQGLEIIANDPIDKDAPNYRSLASKAADAGADCFVFSGITANNAVQLYKDFEAALPDAKLYGPDGVAEAGFVDPKEGGIPPDVAAKVNLTVATLSPEDYPPDGQEFFDSFREKYDEPNPNPYAIYGYEAMRLALDAIERSETGAKEDILAALFETKDRESVLGAYSIDENGDTTLTDYGLYKVEDGELVFDRTIKAKAG